MEKLQIAKNNQMRLVLVGLGLITIIFVAIYFNYFRKIDVVYTHLFYVVIIMVGLWFKRYVVQLAIFLGIFHIILDFLSNGELTAAPILRGGIFLFVAFVIYILINQLESTHENLDHILKSVGDGIIVVDLEKKVTMLNHVAEEMTGWSSEEGRGKDFYTVFNLTHENPACHILNPVEEVLRLNQSYALTNHAIITHRNGRQFHIEDSATPVKDSDGITTGVVLIFRDVSERKSQNAKIEYLSFHDHLTGLYNRRFFEEELKRLDQPRFYPLSIIMGDVNSLKMTNDAFGHLAGDSLIEATGKILKNCCRSSDIVARWGGDEFVLLLPNTDEETTKNIVKRLHQEVNKTQIEQGILSISFGWETKNHLAEDVLDIFKHAENYMYRNKMIMKPGVREKSIEVIIHTLYRKCEDEKKHADAVCFYCKRIAEEMNFNEKEIEIVNTVSLLHDIGKVAIQKEVLDKDEKLSGEEWKDIKRHPEIGYHIINTSPEMAEIATAILCHHERWDGAGYPKGLSGNAIPILARIIAIGAAYDTILSERAYKKSKTKNEAASEILRCAGSQFDPEIVTVFLDKVIETL